MSWLGVPPHVHISRLRFSWSACLYLHDDYDYVNNNENNNKCQLKRLTTLATFTSCDRKF